jgi:rhodanese-related sulfurtransferase
MKRLLVFLAAAALLISFTACGGGGGTTTAPAPTTSSTQMLGTPTQVAGGTYWVITPAQLAGMAKADFFLVNVDDQPTIVIGGTDLFVKAGEINQNLSKFPADKNKKIVIYCIAGVNSKSGAEQLVAAGYTRVMHLEGGTMKWQAMGYPVVVYTTRT